MGAARADFDFIFGKDWDRYAKAARLAPDHREWATVAAGSQLINERSRFGLLIIAMEAGGGEGLNRVCEIVALRYQKRPNRVYLLAIYAGSAPAHEKKRWMEIFELSFEGDAQ